MRCTYQGKSNKGNDKWGNWIFPRMNIHTDVIRFCRRSFKNKYKDYWIGVVYFDDKYIRYTEDFFAEVGVELYPKIHKVVTPLEGEDMYAATCRVANEDISISIDKDVVPICIKVTGVRYSDASGKFHEVIKSVRRVKSLD